MRRREFVALLGGAAAWPLPLSAQQHAMPRIGILLLGGPEPMGPFREALHELGYVEGRNVEIEVRSAQGQASRLPELAAELVGRKVDIIVASLTPAIAAAKNATRDIPIVMAPAGDPVATGLVASLARPGGNVTGVSGTASELGAKSLEVIRELLPAAQRVGVVSNATDPFAKPLLEQIQRGAQPLGLVIHPVAVRTADEMEAAFAEIARERADAVIVSGSLPVRSTVDLALKYRLPSLSNQKSIAEAGALAAYSPSFAERARQCAGYVDRILKGARPAELPVEQPTRFELVINLKTAKAIGLTIPSHASRPRRRGDRMRRRAFIALLGGAAAAWPLAARAQQPAMPVIGFLGSETADAWASRVRAFRQGLSETGHVEGQNVADRIPLGRASQ